MILDFKEIPKANGNELQDTFELLARDLLSYLGFRIIQGPDRGADGIVEENTKGPISEQTLRWLVSCKHFAHHNKGKGKSVSEAEDFNIRDRMESFKCDGFMAFYSTLPSSALSHKINSLPHYIVLDGEKIESLLLQDLHGQRIASRYFPVSFKKYQIENPTPAELLLKTEPLKCEFCGKDIILNDGLLVYLEKHTSSEERGVPLDISIRDFYCSCKGKCDRELRGRYDRQGLYSGAYIEVDDMCNPTGWIRHLMIFIDEIRDKEKSHYSDEAYRKLKSVLVATYPYVARHLTSEERERVKTLLRFGAL